MNKRTAVLVTGSRDWTEYDPIRSRLALYPIGSILIHGDCGEPVSFDHQGQPDQWKGADKIAADLVGVFGFKNWALPYFGDLGKRGGPKRNECMFDVLQALKTAGHQCFVEGFPIGVSVGTRGMLRIVERHNDQCERDGRHSERVSIHVTEGQ